MKPTRKYPLIWHITALSKVIPRPVYPLKTGDMHDIRAEISREVTYARNLMRQCRVE